MPYAILRFEQAQRENPKCKVRKDSVKFIDTIVTASPEFLAELSPESTRQYFEHALDFLKEDFIARFEQQQSQTQEQTQTDVNGCSEKGSAGVPTFAIPSGTALVFGSSISSAGYLCYAEFRC
ncbi:MAG: plasmid recombination protein [Hungatella sp.]